jgi:hypothetical protein
VKARRQLGDLALDEHATLSPSPLLVGIEKATDYARMSARLAMTINGDLASQLLDPSNREREMESLDDYVDVDGWPRLRVVWR